MAIYVCRFCGYIYDPTKGDSQQGVSPGTAFDDLPEDWLCPMCRMPKDMFDRQ
jgi:rubredoxin